jgi:RNA polymerase sigma-70 factor (ECF subfamily)
VPCVVAAWHVARGGADTGRSVPDHFLSRLSDVALIARVTDLGDHDAFDTLMERHLPSLRLVAYRIVSDEHTADDCVQDAVVRMWQNLHSFRGHSQFSTWAYRVVTNVALDRLRRPRHEQPFAHLPDTTEHLGPARHTVGRDELDRLGHALRTLTAEQRASLVLTELDGLSHDEVADILGTTASGVKNRIYRARRRLAELLEGQEGPREEA